MSCRLTQFRQTVGSINQWILLSLILACAAPAQVAAVNASATETELERQRQLYVDIRDRLTKRQISHKDVPYQQLGNYPLVPYLKFQDLSSRLKQLPYREIESFLEEHEGTWLARRLLKSWLETLASINHWHEYQSYYQAEVANTGLKCLYIAAQKRNGNPAALADVAEIWNQGSSQPKRCDPLFASWLESEYFNTDIAWSRYVKAVENRKFALAKYIRKLLAPHQRDLADKLVALYRHPDQIDRYYQLNQKTGEFEDLIHYGIKRFSRKDPIAALISWEKYDSSRLLDAQQRDKTIEYLAFRLILDGHTEPANRLLERNKIVSDRVIQRQVRDALKSQDWAEVTHLVKQMPEEEQQSARWQYWLIRANLARKLITPEEATTGYRELAKQRDFYGFLSAERLQLPFSMAHKAVSATDQEVEAIANIPDMRRSRELYKLGAINQARMEWRYGVRQLAPEQLLAAGKLAHHWGWHRKSIESLGSAKYWDDLDLRFPLIYNQEVTRASKASQVAPQYLLAIARQESAFAADARSPAGAMGLMQLMPATASQTARSIGLRYRKADLLKPNHNFLLGSTYFSQMLERFNGNRILATAAYNAGPHRVDKWLNPAGKEVDYDIWIETIPFKETRGYVQNVLAYSVIYSHRLGLKTQLLHAREKSQPL